MKIGKGFFCCGYSTLTVNLLSLLAIASIKNARVVDMFFCISCTISLCLCCFTYPTI